MLWTDNYNGQLYLSGATREIMTLPIAILKRRRSSWVLQHGAIHATCTTVVVSIVICLEFCVRRGA